MSMLVNPFILGPPPGPTYSEYQSHIATKATSGVRWNATSAEAGKWRGTNTGYDSSSAVYGSTWLSHMWASLGSAIPNAIRHGYPDLTVATNQAANSLEVYFEFVSIGSTTGFTGKSRNGYTSLSDGSTANAIRLIDLIYWDFVLQKPMQMNPYAGTGPTLYTW